VASAQIPNASFENWTNGSPTDWYANNIPSVATPIMSSTIAHSGTYSARGEVVTAFATIFQPILQSGVTAEGFAFTQRPAGFTGYYQFFPAASSGDRFAINVVLFKGGVGGTGVAVAASAPSASVSAFTQFNVPFVYQTADVPDTCVVQIQIIGPGTGQQAIAHVGSYFQLDDIAFTGVIGGVDQQTTQPEVFQLNQNYPNPFNPSTTIRYSLPSSAHIRLSIYDALGREIEILVNGEQSAGWNETQWNAHVPSGLYYFRLEAIGKNGMAFTETKKMLLLR
jgi:hypothetical protein